MMFGFVCYGLGIGMGYYPILKTTWKYFPKKKGFLTGLILCVFGLCPMVFTSIADFVINPEAKPSVNGIFPEDIAKNMKDFALIMAIAMGVCGILSQFLMFPIDHIITTDENEKNDDSNNQVSECNTNVSNEIYSKDKNLEKRNNEEMNTNGVIEVNEPFMQAFKSWRFHLFNFMSVGTLCKL